ncbi:MAG: sialate O-acetylesterase [Planctomycetota bacterium]|jgi:sialate O-acetylesterase
MSRRLFISVVLVAVVGFAGIAAAEEKVRIAVVGDSISKNRNAMGGKGWPLALGKMLGDGYDVRTFSANGVVCLRVPSRNVWGRAEIKHAAKFRPNIVLIMLGTNMGKPGHWVHKGRYASDYRALIAYFKQLETKPKICLCLPIPVHYDNYGISGEIVREGVTPIIKEIAEKDGLPLIDTYAPLADKPECLTDGVHPGLDGMEVIARAVQAALTKKAPADAAARPTGLKLPHVIGDNMVLQRDMPVPIWGWSAPGEKVTVTFGEQEKAATADENGKWRVTLDKLSASSTPAELTVTGEPPAEGEAEPEGGPAKIVVKNVLVGEVWLGSGQSNMHLEVKSLKGRTRPTLAEAEKYPNIRLLLVPPKHANQPQEDRRIAWQPCSGESVRGFSACAYFFARDLHTELKVPIGIISAAKGGEFIEEFAPSIRGRAYNGMVRCVVPFAVRGVIWYQGESNAIKGDGMKYVAKQKALVEDWRKAWGRDEMSFYYVQIAPCASWYRGENLPIFWQAQRACLSIPKTGMVVTTDLVSDGIRNIHPRNKWDVAKRLSLWALAKDYGREGLVYSGPLYRSMTVGEGEAILSFDHVGGGLASRDGKALTHFTIAGKGGNFVKAEAKIARSEDSEVDDILIVASPQVPEPAAVRFAWDKAAQPNFINKEGLPASPFTTESFEQLAEPPAEPAAGQGEEKAAPGLPASDGDPSAHSDKEIEWEKLTTENLVRLLEGSDRKLELSLGVRPGEKTSVLYDLDSRIEAHSERIITDEQWARIRKVLRRHVDAGHWPAGSVFTFAAKYDAEYTAPRLLQCPAAIRWDPHMAFVCLSNAGPKYRDKALRMIRPGLRSVNERKVCETIEIIAESRAEVAADEIHKLTDSLRWMVRLYAMKALVELEDPRVDKVLEKHMGDLTRNSIGLRAPNPFRADEARSTSAGLRSELLLEAARRKLKGTDTACERVFKNSSEAYEGVRWAGCLGLDQLDHDRCVRIVGKLLGSRNDKDIGVALEGITLMEGTGMEGLLESLQALRKKYAGQEAMLYAIQLAEEHIRPVPAKDPVRE